MSMYALSEELSVFSDASDRRFRRTLTALFVPFFFIALLIPLLQLSGLEEGGGDLGDRRLAQLLPEFESAAAEEEPAPVEEPEPEPEPVAEPEPAPEAPPEPEPQVTQAPEPVEPTPEPPQPSARDRVREQFADDFAALREIPDSDTLTAMTDRQLRRSSDVQRAAGSGISGGGSLADSARDDSGATAAGRTRESRPETGIDSGQRRSTQVDRPAGAGAPRERTGSAGDRRAAARSLDEIQLVFDRNKGSFFTLYNRALREDPSLRGKVTLRMTIAPDGSVTDAAIVDSELNHPELERRILARVRTLNFNAKSGIGSFTLNAYPLYFMPS